MSTLGNAAATLGARWQAMSPRERVLVAVLGALIGIAILVYGVVKPLQAARAEATADIRTFETLNARIRAAGSLNPPGSVLRETGPIDQRLNAAAARAGIAVSIVADGGIYRASVSDARYEALVAWLADARAATGAAIARAEILRGATPGQVRAIIEFQP